MSPAPIRVAASQFPVSGDLQKNAKYILKHIAQAAGQNCQVILFPETALSGYAPSHIPQLESFDWGNLEHYLDEICSAAKRHRIWVVLGSMRLLDGQQKTNSLHVISETGKVVDAYDKRHLYGPETAVFEPGSEKTIVEIHGHKCGFLICYDNCFPERYEEYRDAGVELLFHAFYNAENEEPTPIEDLMAANAIVRAADNQMHIVCSNSSAPYSPMPASIVRPDGSSVKARRRRASIIVDTYPAPNLKWTYDNRAG